MKNVLKQAWFWIIIVALVVAGGILFYTNQEEVALTVNGEDFSQAEFDQIVDQIANQQQMYGIEMSKSDIKDRAVEQAVQQILLMDLAENEGIEATDEEIKSKKEELMSRYGAATEEEFLELLKNQGVTDKEQMEDLLAQEIKVGKLMDLYSEEVEITEEDLQTAYDNYKSQVESMNEQSEGETQEVPSFEEMKEDLRSNLVQQKVTPLILEDVNALKEEAEIEEHVTTEDIDIESSESDSPQMEVQSGSETTQEESEETSDQTDEEEEEVTEEN